MILTETDPANLTVYSSPILVRAISIDVQWGRRPVEDLRLELSGRARTNRTREANAGQCWITRMDAGAIASPKSLVRLTLGDRTPALPEVRVGRPG